MNVQYRRGKPAPWMVQVRDINGIIRTRSFTHKRDAEAYEASEKRRRQLQRAGLEAPRDEILFVDYAKTFLSRRFQSSLAKSGVVRDESRLRLYWLEKFGIRPLAMIPSSEIKAHLDHIQFELGHSAADRNRHRALLHKLFQDALMDDKVTYNPVSRIPLLDERTTQRETRYLETASEQESYLRAAYAESTEFGALAMVLLFTGARISEALALQWHDIDFQGETVSLRRMIEKHSRQVVARTKGSVDGRLVPLFARLRDALSSHRGCSGFTRPGDFVINRVDGGFLTYDTYKDAHKRFLAAASLPRITIHDLRRTFASNAQKAGYSKGEIQEILGHSSVVVTERYTRLSIAHLVEKGKRIGFGALGSKHVSRQSAENKQLKRKRSE